VATEALAQPLPAMSKSEPTARARRTRRPTLVTALVATGSKASAEPGAGRVPRRRGVMRVLRIIGGWIIFWIGVVFVILPIIPGTPLVILAAFILAPDVPFFARIRERSKSSYAHITTGIDDVKQRFAEDFHRRFPS
jgi:hypothetical protein